MNITHMIGQMLVMGFQGNQLESAGYQKIRQDIHQGLIGGTIAFRYNIQTPEIFAQLTADLKQSVQGDDPLLMSIDQEGGAVQRLDQRYGYPTYPRALAYGALEAGQRVEISRTMAQDLVRVGVNLNFAPVVDLHDPASKIIGHYGRAFSRDSAHVTLCARDFIAGHHQEGVLTCLKHFPGHGLAFGDSHAGLVDITHTARPDELEVYKHLIGHTDIDMIMTGHLWNKNVDPDQPVTLSPLYINGLLRGQLGYEGVVISDDLHMGAILQNYPIETAVIKAIQAGCDLLIISQNPGSAVGVKDFKPDPMLPEKLHAVILVAIESGEIGTHHLEKSYERIHKMKNALCLK